MATCEFLCALYECKGSLGCSDNGSFQEVRTGMIYRTLCPLDDVGVVRDLTLVLMDHAVLGEDASAS